MMKLIKVAFILLFFISEYAFSQRLHPVYYKVQYKVEYNRDTLPPYHKVSEIGFVYTSAHNGLFFKYTQAPNKFMPTIKSATQNQNTQNKQAWFQNLFSQKITAAKTDNPQLQFTNAQRSLQWHLTDSTAIKMGYTAYKATTKFKGQDWVAWFTTNAPIHESPRPFNRLPGLLVELHNIEHTFTFTLVSIKPIENPEILFIREEKTPSPIMIRKQKDNTDNRIFSKKVD